MKKMKKSTQKIVEKLSELNIIANSKLIDDHNWSNKFDFVESIELSDFGSMAAIYKNAKVDIYLGDMVQEDNLENQLFIQLRYRWEHTGGGSNGYDTVFYTDNEKWIQRN